MKKYTLYLVVTGFALSGLSLITISETGSEIYPFFTWKLFGRPYGSAPEDTSIYRIYGVKGKDTIRIPLKDTPDFDRDITFGIINGCASLVEQGKDVAYNRKKLNDLAHITSPGYDTYFVVREDFDPHKIATPGFTFSKKLITRLP